MKKKYLVIVILVFIVLAMFVGFRLLFPNTNNQDTEQKTYNQQVSELVVPIDIDLTSFEPVLNAQMEAEEYFYEDTIDVKKNISLVIKIKKTGQAQLYPENGEIKLVLPMLIEIDPNVKGILALGVSKNTQLTARVTIYSTIKGSLNEDYSLNADTKSRFTIEETPELSVLGFNIDFGKQLKNALEVGADEINQSINEQLKEIINTKKIVNDIFAEIKEPYQINDKPFETWANINIQTVEANQLKPARPGVLNLTVKMNGLFDIKAGEKPALEEKTLPFATFTEENFGKKSTLNIPLILDKETVVEYLNKEHSPTSFQLKGEQFVIGNFVLQPSSTKLKMKATFSYRGVEGDVVLAGIPVFDEETQSISLSKLYIKSKSNQKVIDGIVNVLQKNPQLKQKIEQELEYSLKDDLVKLKVGITNQLKTTRFNEFAHLDGYVEDISLKDVYVQENTFLIDTQIKAAAVVQVEANEE